VNKKRILIVEDESILALDLKNRLEKMGYFVTGMVTKGEHAFEMAFETEPDLVLMDIKLAGKIDGIQAAEHMRKLFSLPIIYVTAYSDDATLQRAKRTQPFGYIVKPITNQVLQSNIEMSLYNHKMKQRLEENEQWLTAMLRSIHEGVIATSDQIYIRLMNPIAEFLTGWDENTAIGLPINQVFDILNPKDKIPVPNIFKEISPSGKGKPYLLVSRQGVETLIYAKMALIRSEQGLVNGIVVIFNTQN